MANPFVGQEVVNHRMQGDRVRVVDLLAMAWRIVTIWSNRAHHRRVLGELDDDQLRDIGVSRVEAAEEVRKPFWLS
ncbi:DUF1127 domain-containing protein [Bradyrhizobium sp. INPA03-11B]|uniref:DUF1127 domain-containing protein n=1 Tax=Bradyrhizobium sp. INPA03-11B TaxID=418598 RepID=UPI00338F26A4